MAPVTWTRGPWATRQPSTPQPYQYLMEQKAREAAPYSELISPTPTEGAGQGAPSTGGVSEYGPYDTNKAIGQMGLRGLNLGISAGLLGASLGPHNFAGFAIPAAAIIAKLAGVVPGTTYSEPDIQGIRDTFGDFAAREAASKMASDIAQGGNPATTERGNMPDAPSVGNPDSPFGRGGDPGGQTGGIGGDPSSDAAGSSKGGEGPDYAKGGVSRVRRPTRARYGEAGPETAIFVPEKMKRKGFQGRERQVRRGLKSAYSSLVQ